MRVTYVQDQVLAFLRCTVANAVYLEGLGESFGYADDPFADEVTMTVSQDGKTATYSQTDLGTQQITITGKTKAEPLPEPVVTNNVANTTVNVSGDTVTLTCADGYVFDGTPKVTLDNDPMADEMPMTVSGDKKTATLSTF